MDWVLKKYKFTWKIRDPSGKNIPNEEMIDPKHRDVKNVACLAAEAHSRN